jgi:amino acid transporter
VKYNKLSLWAFWTALFPVLFFIVLITTAYINPPWAWLHGRGGYEYGNWFPLFMSLLIVVVNLLVPILSVIFGLIAFRRAKKLGEKGKFLSVLAVIISLLVIILAVSSALSQGDVGVAW